MLNEPTNGTLHIGIVASTAGGAALCYRTLCQEGTELLGPYRHPEMTMHTFSLRSYLDAIDRDDWAAVAALMSQSAIKLAQVGADLIICPNNTLHRAFHLVESPVPWLHIAHVVAEEASRRGFRRVGILGTQIVMESGLYTPALRKFTIAPAIPEGDDRSRIQHIIMTELIAGRVTTTSRMFLQEVITRFKAEGAEAVVLGCTELPLLISEDQSALPLLDSTHLLARAALVYARSSEQGLPAQGRSTSVPHHVPYTL